MKKYLLFILNLAVIICYSYHIQAQCTPNGQCSSICPDSATGLPIANANLPYSTIITIRVPASSVSMGLTLAIDSMKITSITGLPAGFSYACNDPRCTWNGNTFGCIFISGIPSTSMSNQTFPLVINMNVYALVFGNPQVVSQTIKYYKIDVKNYCNPLINIQPQNTSNTIGSTAKILVHSSAPSALYKWQTNLGVGFQDLSNAGQYSGTSNDTLSISNINITNDKQYFRCIVSDGSCSDTSVMVSIKVVCNTLISTQPQNQSANIGSSARFFVISFDPTTVYKWQTNLGFGFQNISNAGQYNGANNDTLVIANLSISNNNQYFRCITSSSSCTDTSNLAVLTVTNTVNIADIVSNNEFIIFPNPSREIITIKTKYNMHNSTYRIIDQQGRVFMLGKLTDEITSINIEFLSDGAYIFQIDGKIEKKFNVLKRN